MAKSGLLLVDKPAGFTSHDVVAMARKILGTRKVGHAGTLDPMATGLLVLGVESGTKLLTFIVGQDKTYEATIRLGAATHTDDAEGDVISTADPKLLVAVTDGEIMAAISKLTGPISQIPSSVSAIKVSGVRAYDLVRAGEAVELKAREVTVSRFELIGAIRRSTDSIELDVVIDCSSGTYIRALARDIGQALGVGGHLTKLRRTRVGNFLTEKASSLEDLNQESTIGLLEAAREVLPSIELESQQVVEIRHGKRIDGSIAEVTALTFSRELIAIAEPVEGSKIKSLVVFNEVNND